MARFRAYASDSSDDGAGTEPDEHPSHPSEDESESEGDEDSSSSSSSEMHEDDLLTSRLLRKQAHRRKAWVEDEDEEIQDVREMNDDRRPAVRVSPASSSSSSSPPARAPRDPTIIPWAQHIGVDAQKMHVMQTSLFRMPEEAAALKAMKDSAPSNLRIPLQPLNRKHSRDSDGDGLRIDSREVCHPLMFLSSASDSVSIRVAYVYPSYSAPHLLMIYIPHLTALRGSMHGLKPPSLQYMERKVTW